jgi:hypothetical protein
MARFASKSRISDELLVEAIRRAENGLIDADLGGGVIKQRVGRQGQGRSGGYRTLIAFRSGDRAVFVFAFAKNERDNIGPLELEDFQDLARKWLYANEAGIAKAIDMGEIEEVWDGKI